MIVGLKSADPAAPGIIEMNADKDRVLLAVGNRGAVVEVHEDITRTGHDDAELGFTQLRRQARRDIESRVFFRASVAAESPVILSAVAGINHYGREGSGGIFDLDTGCAAATDQEKTGARGEQNSKTDVHGECHTA